jgi:hypothetical protein
MPAKPKAKPRSAKRGGLGYAIEHAAYHEAGHAVLALVCQAAVRRATIKPRGNRRGRVIFDSHLEPTADLMILIALAGPFAQRRFVPKSDWITASDFNSVLKAIFDKGNGSAKRKRKTSGRCCRQRRTGSRFLLERHQGRGEGAAQARDANRR